MNIGEATSNLTQSLQSIYDTSEANNIAGWVMEWITGKDRLARHLEVYAPLNAKQVSDLERCMSELLNHRPVQYVLGECYFLDMKLFVDERVLIPRPETEELADWIIRYQKEKNIIDLNILDIGTGSGCLALAIKKNIKSATVFAADISDGALSVAGKNAGDLDLDLHFLQRDILDIHVWQELPLMDIIVSNPPYITLPEESSILPNVLAYEPHVALFVTNNDPLQFYKAIEALAEQKLKKEGAIFMELHRDFATETESFYLSKGWKTELRKDMQGENRMLLCYKF